MIISILEWILKALFIVLTLLFILKEYPIPCPDLFLVLTCFVYLFFQLHKKKQTQKDAITIFIKE